MLPKQTINVVPAGAGVAVMKEEYGRSLQILLRRLRHGAADCLRQCREPVAGPRGGAPRTNRTAPGGRGQPAANCRAGPGGGDPAGGGRRNCGARGGSTGGASAARFGISRLAVPPHQSLCRRPWSSRSRSAVALLTGIIFGAAPAWFATRTDPVEALRGAGRSTRDHSSFARKALLIVQAALSVVSGGGRDHAGAKPQQTRAPEFRIPDGRPRGGFLEPAPGYLHAAAAGVALSPD